MELELRINNFKKENLPAKFDLEIKQKEIHPEIYINSIPSDKSISQRAIVLNALASGRSIVRNVLQSNDIYNCVEALKALGVNIVWENNNLLIEGVGITGLKQPKEKVYIGNSATSARLLTCIIAGSSLKVELHGNELLSKRPMEWTVKPLREMGAKITYLGRENKLPLLIEGQYPLKAINQQGTVASAQEKTVILIAGILAEGVTKYKQICQSRNHTERMLNYFGFRVSSNYNITEIEGRKSYKARNIDVPGDISSAAFMLTAGIIHNNYGLDKLVVKNVGVNPTRLGFVQAVKQMGLIIECENKHSNAGEPIADLIFKNRDSEIRGIEVSGQEFVQSLIDEVPLLGIISAYAEGETIFRECNELADKDTNRIETTAQMLRAFGAEVETSREGMIVKGKAKLHEARVNSYGDHRIAMAAAILASSLPGYSYIEDCECMFVSYPSFLQDLANFADIKVIPRI